MNAQHLKGKSRLRHNSTPPTWAPGSEQILSSKNSIDLFDAYTDSSADDSDNDYFDDIGMEINLSNNLTRTRKPTSSWMMSFSVNNLFM